MFYVGHFWWVGPEPEYGADPQKNGWFTCLAEADSVEEAGEKLRDLVEDLGSWYVGFEDVREVFLSAVVEVRKLPEAGVLAHFETNDRYGGMEAPVLPGVPLEFCAAFELEGVEGDGWVGHDAFAAFDG